jgi:hypothetical protein
MLRVLAVLLLLAQCGAAQIGFATSDDGGVLIIDLSARLAGTQDDFAAKIFRYDQTGWSVVEELPANSYSAGMIGDARIIRVVTTHPCTGSCIYGPPPGSTAFIGLTQPILIEGPSLSISHNGRYLVTPGLLLPCGESKCFLNGAVQNLETGEIWRDPVISQFLPAQIGDDGTIIGRQVQGPDQNGAPINALARWRPGQPVATVLT